MSVVLLRNPESKRPLRGPVLSWEPNSTVSGPSRQSAEESGLDWTGLDWTVTGSSGRL